MNRNNTIDVHLAVGKQTYQVNIMRIGHEYCRAAKMP